MGRGGGGGEEREEGEEGQEGGGIYIRMGGVDRYIETMVLKSGKYEM